MGVCDGCSGEGVSRKHGNAKYPWDEWLDGRIWKLEEEEDFQVAPESMRAIAYHAARVKGLKIRVQIDNECVYIQAYEE